MLLGSVAASSGDAFRSVASRPGDALIPNVNAADTPRRPAAASQLVAAGEEAWRSIQDRHDDVPDVVLVLGTGVERGRLVKLGHWWDGRWTADGQVRGEVLLAGEALHLPPAQVFEVLLHEAAHGLNAVRGVQDTSRGGRYHNGRFKAAAEELGLVVSQMPPYGWAQTELGPEALMSYGSDIAAIGEAMRIARRIGGNVRLDGAEETAGVGGIAEDGAAAADGERGPTSGPAMCGCGRRMRMAPSVLAQGPVLCGLCGQEFATERATEQAVTPHPSRVDPAQVATAPAPSEPAIAEQAIRTLTSLASTVEGALLLAEVGAWREAHRSGEPRAVEVATVNELADANAAARALLKLDGELTGAPVEVDGRELLVGDLVMVGEHHLALVDLDGVELPPAGVLGTVIRNDPNIGSFVVDFPIAGTNRLDVHSPAAGALEYGYAEVVGQVGAPLIDLRTLPESVPPDPPELSLVPELSW